MAVPRLRVFAGPNGSGKSTIKNVLRKDQLYIYVNADDLEKEAKVTGCIDLSPFGLQPSQQSFDAFYSDHPLTERSKQQNDVQFFSLNGSTLKIGPVDLNSYHASVITDFIRHQLLEVGASFTFETVMSDRSKIEFMRKAKARGYRTYLYFVSTEDVSINQNRVQIRVAGNGHNVAPKKIEERYYRCLALLPEALLETDRAYIFDNSGAESELEVEVTDASTYIYKVGLAHDWCINAMEDFTELLLQNMAAEDRE